MTTYGQTGWTDDDGSGTVGTLITAARMNNIESFLSYLDVQQAGPGALQEGVFGSGDYALSSVVVTAASGRISYSRAGGQSWQQDAMGNLGGFSRPITTGILYTPTTLPASLSQFVGVGINLDRDSLGPTYTLTTVQTSAANALAALNTAEASHAIRIADLVITGAAGTYALSGAVRDRRPWALGGFYPITRSSGNYTTSSGALADVDATNLSTRMECSGVPVRLSLKGLFSINAVNTFNGFAITMDGTVVVREDPGSPVSGCQIPVCVEGIVTPSAGSHLFRPQFGTGGSGTLTLMAANATDNQLFFTVEELVRTSGRNGTS